MVMEVPPSPQCVGREFVRQYYTLLNQAPAHLHRFYSENSLFIHGGLDVPNRETKQVVGQEQIHEHIQQLNFRDCHAKISQNGQGEDYYSGGSEVNNGGSHQLIEETPPPSFPPPPAVTQPVQELPPTPTPVPAPAPVVAPIPTQQFPTVKQVEDSVVSAPQVQAEPSPPSPVKEEEWGDTSSSPPPPSPPPVISNEPKTYANLLKGSTNTSYNTHQNNSLAYQTPLSPPPSSLQKPSDHNNSSRDHMHPRSSMPPSSQPRGPRPGPGAPRGGMRDRPSQRASFSEDNDSEKSMGYRGGPAPPRHSQGGGNFVTTNGVQYNDNQQLFMGNIPLTAQEDELRALFGPFGTILDLKIFSKPTMKGPRVPNYGFLIYEDPSTVQTVLMHRPIYFPNAKDPNGVKLNVEEKKRRNPGQGPDSRPPMDSRPRGGGLSMRGGRGGPRGGGGGMYRGGDSGRGGNLPPNSNMSGGGLRNSTSNNGFNKGR
uniref:Ras GTPase-activating protein-binding protein 2 n=1 Tax=Cacopsylla melanoneura TaxID=428564 RepID=A0A8D8RGU9_9HEMI